MTCFESFKNSSARGIAGLFFNASVCVRNCHTEGVQLLFTG